MLCFTVQLVAMDITIELSNKSTTKTFLLVLSVYDFIQSEVAVVDPRFDFMGAWTLSTGVCGADA